uniref:Uncharacterized protein n=1 Tax=viral metagenome TaxID=1070528 RepID=A0A6C0JM09_9ZZZZ
MPKDLDNTKTNKRPLDKSSDSSQDSKISRCSSSSSNVSAFTELSELFVRPVNYEEGETYVERTKQLVKMQIEKASTDEAPVVFNFAENQQKQHGDVSDSKSYIYAAIKDLLPVLKTTKIVLDERCKQNKDAANVEAKKNETSQNWASIITQKSLLDKEVDKYIAALWRIEESIVFKLRFNPELANVEFLIPKVQNSDGTPERPAFQTLLSISIDYGLSYLLQILLKLKHPFLGFNGKELTLFVFEKEKNQYLTQLTTLRKSFEEGSANYIGYNSSIYQLSQLGSTTDGFGRAKYPESSSIPQNVFIRSQEFVSPLPSQEYSDEAPHEYSDEAPQESCQDNVLSFLRVSDSDSAKSVPDEQSIMTGRDSLLLGMNELIDSLQLSSLKLHDTIESDSAARGGKKSKKSKKSKRKSKRKSKKSRKTKRTK